MIVAAKGDFGFVNNYKAKNFSLNGEFHGTDGTSLARPFPALIAVSRPKIYL